MALRINFIKVRIIYLYLEQLNNNMHIASIEFLSNSEDKRNNYLLLFGDVSKGKIEVKT
jgi:hypothetical protein